MNRRDFKHLRDLSGKTISAAIKLTPKQACRPLLTTDRIAIENAGGARLWMNINYNPETGTKGVNVTHEGEGPICRLDVDGTQHGPAGRSHKHSVQNENSVNENLRDGVVARADLSGKTLREVFDDFCSAANITFTGTFDAPDEGGGQS